jgi:AcrR family transcriptional regulator
MLMSAPAEGLRERKKRQTREAIAATAMRLFAARGFDAVTVADVARAADVSEKTVFNHFPTKEDLVLSRSSEGRAALVDAVRSRPPGTSVVDPFRAATAAWLDRVAREPVRSTIAVPRLVRTSRSLRMHLFIGWEEQAALLAPLIAEAMGEPPGGVVAEAATRSLTWTHRAAVRTTHRRLLAGEDKAAVAADVRAQADRAYDLLEAGYAGLGARSD